MWHPYFRFTSSGAAPVVVEQFSGGFETRFFNDYDRYSQKRRQLLKRKDELEELEEAKELSEVDREIARFLREQELKDAERQDLQRLQALANEYAGKGTKIGLPARVRASILKAQEERTRNSLEQLRREIERMLEEEEMAIVAALLLDD